MYVIYSIVSDDGQCVSIFRNGNYFAVFIKVDANTRKLGELESCCVRPSPKV